MAQSYTTDSGSVLTIPGTYVSQRVISNAAAPITIGVVTLIGEANEGPDFTQESDLASIGYTPDQLGQVVSKYGSGRLVDAFRGCITANRDAEIGGAPALIKLIKTNKSAAAQYQVAREGFGAYSLVSALKQGTNGNLVKYSAAVAAYEVAAQAKDILYAPAYDSSKSFSLRANGGDANAVVCAVKMGADDLVTALTDLSKDLLATGGAKVLPLTGNSTIALTAALVAGSTDKLQVTLASGSIFTSAPAEGDTVIIPSSTDFGAANSSCIHGAGAVNNSGAYVVVQVTNTASNASLVLKKLSGPAGATIGAATGAIHASEDDLIVYKAINLYNISGQDRQATVGLVGTFTCSLNDGINVTIDAPTDFAAQAQNGDIVKFLADFAGIKAGAYQVIGSDTNSISLVRLSNDTAGVTGSAIVAAPITASTQPFLVLKSTIDGLGKTLEVVGNVESIFKDKSTFAGANLSNKMIVSAVEQKMAVSVYKGTQGQTFTVGGDVLLQLCSTLANAYVIFGSSKAEFYGNSVKVFEASYSQFKTLNDLAEYISSQTKFSAKIVNPKWSSFPSKELDKGTFTITSSDLSRKAGQIKADAYSFKTLVGSSSLVSVAQSGQGLPEVQSAVFLAGGLKGATKSADAIAAIDACESLETNFLVTCFAQDADADIFADETDSASTYVVDAINAYAASHCVKMSAEKMRKKRLAIVAKAGKFEECKDAAAQLASFRAALAFQPALDTASDGTQKLFQPWMTAVKAAGQSAAAGYKGIVKKFVGVSGVGAVVDYNPSNLGDQENALKAGLLVLERVPTGGFRWVSDQTTYSVDNNFVFNSVQAVYLADLIALRLIARFDRAIVGKSVAEISAAAAKSILDSEMFDILRLKWIAPSDDGAPKGYKNVNIKLTGGVMAIALEIKIAGLIYFVPVNMAISQVEQSA